MNLKEIETRETEIRELVKGELTVEQIDSFTAEVEALKIEREAIEKDLEVRAELIKATLDGEGFVIEEKKEDKKPMEIMDVKTVIQTPEYRNAFLKRLQGVELNDTEKRANEIALTNAGGVIPTQTQQYIFNKMVQIAPLLNEITLLRVNGNVTFAVEGTNNAAILHSENASITPSADTMVSVSLGGYEIVKLVRISASVRSMSIDAFEGWLGDMLAEALARKIEYYICVGDGNGMPKGVDKAQTWSDASNGVDWAGAVPTAAEIIELASYLPGGYARNAKWLINHKTFFAEVYSLRDDAKSPLVREVAGGYTIMGFPVLFSDYCPAGEIYFGDFKKVVGNLAADINVASSLDSGFQYNAIDFRGACVFDCDIAVGEAFVKGEATLA